MYVRIIMCAEIHTLKRVEVACTNLRRTDVKPRGLKVVLICRDVTDLGYRVLYTHQHSCIHWL